MLLLQPKRVYTVTKVTFNFHCLLSYKETYQYGKYSRKQG